MKVIPLVDFITFKCFYPSTKFWKHFVEPWKKYTFPSQNANYPGNWSSK